MLKRLMAVLIPFLFLSCESPFVDMSAVSCTLDKETYKKGEDIFLRCRGSFEPKDEQYEGYVRLTFWVFKLIDGEIDSENYISYQIIDCGKLEYDKNMYSDNYH